MESIVKLDRKVRLRNPVLIEGLPGIGFVANISAVHLINSLKAKKLGEISSPNFQDIVISTEDGKIRSPVHEIYYWKSSGGPHDLIILYGNTQALTVQGQYELCGRILSFAQDMGCKLIICIGGLQKDKIPIPPRLYCTATDFETLREIRSHGLDIFQGHIYGMAGLLLGLARLREMRGFCVLAETLGTYPDPVAAKAVLDSLNAILGLGVDLEGLEKAADNVSKILESFGLVEAKRSREFFGPV